MNAQEAANYYSLDDLVFFDEHGNCGNADEQNVITDAIMYRKIFDKLTQNPSRIK